MVAFMIILRVLKTDGLRLLPLLPLNIGALCLRALRAVRKYFGASRHPDWNNLREFSIRVFSRGSIGQRHFPRCRAGSQYRAALWPVYKALRPCMWQRGRDQSRAPSWRSSDETLHAVGRCTEASEQDGAIAELEGQTSVPLSRRLPSTSARVPLGFHPLDSGCRAAKHPPA